MIDLSWAREPVRLKAVIQSVITLLAVVGVALTSTQQDAIQNFAATAVVLITAFGLFDAKVLRNKVTPSDAPTVTEGTTVTVTTPPGEPDRVIVA